MKILLLSAANSIHTRRWAYAFAKMDHKVFVISLINHKTDENYEHDNISVHYLKIAGTKGYYLNVGELRRYCNRIKPDVLNVHYASGYGTLARLSKIHPVVLNVWGSDIYFFPNESKLKRKILRKNICYADRIASTSKCMANELIKSMGVKNMDICITPFGVDISHFSPFIKNRGNGIFIFGTVKAYKKVYGIDHIVNAFCLFYSEWKKLDGKKDIPYLELYGRGEEKETICEIVKINKMEKNISVNDYILHEELPDIIRKFDASCFYSEHESFGVSVLESMACGIPVIISDVDGFLEVTDKGKIALVAKQDDEKELADKMMQMYLSENKRKELSQQGREWVCKEYDWEKNARILEQLLYMTSKEWKNSRI